MALQITLRAGRWWGGLFAAFAAALLLSSARADDTPAKPGWRALPNLLGANASYRCYHARFDRYAKEKKEVWTCEVKNDTSRDFKLSIRLTDRDTKIEKVTALHSRSTVKAGEAKTFPSMWLAVPAGGDVTFWHGGWCWDEGGGRCVSSFEVLTASPEDDHLQGTVECGGEEHAYRVRLFQTAAKGVVAIQVFSARGIVTRKADGLLETATRPTAEVAVTFPILRDDEVHDVALAKKDLAAMVCGDEAPGPFAETFLSKLQSLVMPPDRCKGSEGKDLPEVCRTSRWAPSLGERG